MTPLLLTLFACTAPDSGTDPTGPQDSSNSGNPLDDVVRITEPEQSLEDLTAAAEAILGRGLPELFTLRDAYASFLQVRESDCPGTPDEDPDRVDGIWANDCETTAGVGFYGTGIWDEAQDTESGLTTLEMDLLASWELTDTSGQVFVSGGEADLLREAQGETIDVTAFIGGTYTYTDGWTSWLDPGLETSLAAAASLDGQTTVWLEGGVGSDEGALRFADTQFVLEDCSGLPTGVLQLRDSSSYWVEITFPGCEPCAPATFLGHDLGEICLGEAVANAALALGEKLLTVQVIE